MTPPPALSPDHIVTASNLVRHFGIWQVRAAQAPLYILQRGRPRFVLVSIETMHALCAPHNAAPPAEDTAPNGIDWTQVIDAVRERVIVAERSGAIGASSRSARAHFGPLAEPGAPVEALTPPPFRALFERVFQQVADAGAGDALEIPSAARSGALLALRLEPAGGGVALFADEARDAAWLTARSPASDAVLAAMLACAGIAAVIMDMRGQIVAPDPTLTALTGMASADLAGTTLDSWIAPEQRAVLSGAIASALSGATPPALLAQLGPQCRAPTRLRIGIAPLHAGGAVAGAAAILIAAP